MINSGMMSNERKAISLDTWKQEDILNDLALASDSPNYQDDIEREAIYETIETPRFVVPKGPHWDGDSEYIEDDSEMIEIIHDLGICVIEEPLTCCDELPEEDLTEFYNKIVEDPIQDLLTIRSELAFIQESTDEEIAEWKRKREEELRQEEEEDRQRWLEWKRQEELNKYK